MDEHRYSRENAKQRFDGEASWGQTIVAKGRTAAGYGESIGEQESRERADRATQSRPGRLRLQRCKGQHVVGGEGKTSSEFLLSRRERGRGF